MTDAVLAIDANDIGGVVAPIAVIAGCLVIIVISALVTRRRRRRDDEDPVAPEAAIGTDAGDGTGTDWHERPTDLTEWQSGHGHSVDRWLDAHEGSLGGLHAGADPALDPEVDRAMTDAAAACPDPALAASLGGMLETARTTRAALAGDDRPTAESAHDAYARHRAEAIQAMTAPAPEAG